MTDPVILLGTQSNGETLPVQVDAFGRLVAEGLLGPEGPQGPEGPEGPEGPAGQNGIGVPLPYGDEGSVLTIVDGAPAWKGGDPGPLPSLEWSSFLQLSDGGYWVSGYGPHKAFDGTYTTFAICRPGGSSITWAPGQLFGPITSLKVWAGGTEAEPNEIVVNGRTTIDSVSASAEGIVLSRNVGDEWRPETTLKVTRLSSSADIHLNQIELNGTIFVDPPNAQRDYLEDQVSRLRQLVIDMSSDIDPS